MRNLKDEAGWYMMIPNENDLGLDGLYHLTTIGCGCCAGYEKLTPDEYIILLGHMKDMIEKEIENVKLRKRVS